MSGLRKRYIECLRILTGIIVVLALVAHKALEPNKELQEYITSSASLLFLVGEWAIRRRIWKYTNPRVYLDGEWYGVSVFEGVELGAHPASAPFLPPSVAYKVLFEQDCLSISIAPTGAEHFVNWASDSLSVDDNGNIVFSYHVRYSNGLPPAEATGIERMDVVERDSRGRPTIMRGTFAQCARGFYPVFRGRVEYRRGKFSASPTARDFAIEALIPGGG